MRFNIAGSEEKFRQMARKWEIPEETGEGLVSRLFKLNERIGIPSRLREIGVLEEHLDPLADLAIDDFAHPNNPKPVSRADFRALYAEAW
jgi:alcohol dehydrogenase class IV